MRKLSEIKVKDRTLTLRELTVGQVVTIIDRMGEHTERTALDWMFEDQYLPEYMLDVIAGEKIQDLARDLELAPSELEAVYKEAIKVNPFLSQALEKMCEIGRKIQEMEAGQFKQPLPG